MQSSQWVTLLARIPAALHNTLVLITTVGTEVAVQDIFRLEDEYVVLRGRMSGTTDAGRVFFIPYDQVHYIGFQKPLKQEDVLALYGDAPAPPAPAPAPAEVRPAEVTEPAPQAKAEPAPPPEQAPAERPPKPPSKVLLLERVRARLAAAQQAKSGSK